MHTLLFPCRVMANYEPKGQAVASLRLIALVDARRQTEWST